MHIRKFFLASFLAFIAASSMAAAATGWVERDLNLRTGPGTSYPKILAMPVGARVEVYSCTSWCEISYAGHHGWASARYISMGGFRPGPAGFERPPMPPVIDWHLGRRPWWDERHHAWYDGRRWWHRNRWHDRPHIGFYFEFGR